MREYCLLPVRNETNFETSRICLMVEMTSVSAGFVALIFVKGLSDCFENQSA